MNLSSVRVCHAPARGRAHRDGAREAREPTRVLFATGQTGREDVRVDGDTVSVLNRERIVRTVGSTAHAVLVEVDGITSPWSIARNADTLWMGQAGFSWPLVVVSAEAELRESLAAIERETHPTSPEVRSPMPGTVVAVPVTSGDRVQAGDTIVTVEAMKMEHKLTATVTGTVTLSARPGDLVKLNELLATIEPVDSERTKEQAS